VKCTRLEIGEPDTLSLALGAGAVAEALVDVADPERRTEEELGDAMLLDTVDGLRDTEDVVSVEEGARAAGDVDIASAVIKLLEVIVVAKSACRHFSALGIWEWSFHKSENR